MDFSDSGNFSPEISALKQNQRNWYKNRIEHTAMVLSFHRSRNVDSLFSWAQRVKLNYLHEHMLSFIFFVSSFIEHASPYGKVMYLHFNAFIDAFEVYVNTHLLTGLLHLLVQRTDFPLSCVFSLNKKLFFFFYCSNASDPSKTFPLCFSTAILSLAILMTKLI